MSLIAFSSAPQRLGGRVDMGTGLTINTSDVNVAAPDSVTKTPELAQAISVIPGYASALNEIIKPDKILVLTRYFLRRWMPLLGDNGTRIIIALRSIGYYNRQTGETRDGVEIDLPELAALCGISVPTVKRESGEAHGKDRRAIPGSQQNPTIHLFIKKERKYWRDPVTNRLLRTANIYRVPMDDPLHPDDLPRLREVLDARDKNAPSPSKAHNDPKPPRNRVASAPSKAQSDSQNAESEARGDEIEPFLKDEFSGLQLPKNTSFDAPEILASLFSEPNSDKKEPGTATAPSDWASLTPDQQRPYRDQARSKLLAIHAGSRITPKPKLIEVRAQSKYEATGALELGKAMPLQIASFAGPFRASETCIDTKLNIRESAELFAHLSADEAPLVFALGGCSLASGSCLRG